MVRFRDLPIAESCRRIDFEKVEIGPGMAGSWLKVSGPTPWMSMEVKLVPLLIYDQKPEYWGIEVVGCITSGFEMEPTDIEPYNVAIPLGEHIGTKGIEVIGATRREKVEILPK